MPEPEPKPSTVPISDLPAEERAARSSSFGGVATDYERFRPGPPLAAVDWYLPEPVRRVVDLGAGTGALTRLLLDRAEEVAAVEPDDRMRSVLAERVPGANALAGRGEAIPMPDDSVDAVIAATSWHWMEVEPTLREVGRILVPGGVLGAVWSAPDVEGAFFTQARELLASGGQGADTATAADPTIAGLIGDNPDPTATTLAIPRGLRVRGARASGLPVEHRAQRRRVDRAARDHQLDHHDAVGPPGACHRRSAPPPRRGVGRRRRRDGGHRVQGRRLADSLHRLTGFSANGPAGGPFEARRTRAHRHPRRGPLRNANRRRTPSPTAPHRREARTEAPDCERSCTA